MNFLFQDFSKNKGKNRVRILLILFRACSFFNKNGKFSILWWISLPLQIIYRIYSEVVLNIELRPSTKIGKNFCIDHGFGLVINDQTVIGDDCRIRHLVTIGCKIMHDGSQGKSPRIGNNVDIGSGAQIIGDINIGNNVMIGSGAVVVKDVPDGCKVVGNPSRLIVK